MKNYCSLIFLFNFVKTFPISAFQFKQHEKLKSRKLTEQLFKEGKSFNLFPFRVVYLVSETGFTVPAGKAFQPGFPVQFGVGVGARYFKKAVHRNRVKRLTREAWRLHKHLLYATLLPSGKQMAVFFLFTGKTLPGYPLAEEKIKAAIEKLQRIATA